MTPRHHHYNHEIDGGTTAGTSSSTSLLNNVDICAAILAEKPPKLPLREELNSLGFEVVLSAAGTGIRLSKDESVRAVQTYRKSLSAKDLKKRRFFPKSSKRIKEVLHERKRMEHEISLPHAFSYETYDIRLRSFDHANSSDNNNNNNHSRLPNGTAAASVGSDSDSKNNKKQQQRWNMHLLRKTKKSKKTTPKATTTTLPGGEEMQTFEHLSSQAMFPDALLSSDDSNPSSASSESSFYNTGNEEDQPDTVTNGSDSNHNNSSSSSENFSSLASTTKSGRMNHHDNPVLSQRTQALQQQQRPPPTTTALGEGWDHTVLFNNAMEEEDDSSAAMGPLQQQSKLNNNKNSNNKMRNQMMSMMRIDTTTLSPIGQDIVPDVFGAFDMIDNESIHSSSVHTHHSKPLQLRHHNNQHHHYHHGMDPDGTTATNHANANATATTTTMVVDPPTTVEELLLLQYSMSDDNPLHSNKRNKEYSSPTTKQPTGSEPPPPPYFQEEKKEDEELEVKTIVEVVDPMVLAFGKFVTKHPLDGSDDATDVVTDRVQEQPSLQYQQQQHPIQMESIQDVLHQADHMLSFPTTASAQHDPHRHHDIKLHDETELEERIPVEDSRSNNVDIEDDTSTVDEILSTAGTVVVAGTDVPIVDDVNVLLLQPPLLIFENEATLEATTTVPSSVEQRPEDVTTSTTPSHPVVDDVKVPMSAFERATAEILRVAGIEIMKGPPVSALDSNNNIPSPTTTNPATGLKAPEKKNEADWMKSAKSVFDNFSTGVLKVAGIDTNTTEPVVQQSSAAPNNNKNTTSTPHTSPTSRIADITTLFESIIVYDVPVQDVETIISASPDLTQVRRNLDGRLPLHELCDRGMPDRSGFPIATLTDYLLKDISNYQALIFIVVDSYPAACLMQDKNFDLPVHLIARRLMEWEATWYEIVYQKAAKERNASGVTAIAITKLYQTMSTSIERLLLPLVEMSSDDSSNLLCQYTGSMGTILPLHIACIFTVSVRCLRLILEAYPESATIPCDLGILHTFIPDECLPLELHDNLSTDAPKWEIEVSGSPLPIDSDVPGEDGIRRSDLLFSYNPIEPHRLEKPRIRRLESRINYDSMIVFGKDEKILDRAHQRVWVWMCSFREPDTGRPTYVNCVKRIISSLPIQSIRHLVSVTSDNGAQLMDIASTECLKVIQMRLEQLYEIEPPLELKLSDEASVSAYEKELVGQLCRLVFNVPDAPFPTSFIILPYMLSQEADGSLRLASPESANIAFQFAECLLNLTDPRSILFILDAKSNDHYGQRLYDTSEISDFHLQELARVDSYADSFRSLYEAGDAFLYLVDESTGLPRIDASSSIYPIVLTAPATLVQKLLPLMMMSMVQMRGEKAIPKLATVILDDNVAFVPTRWAAASDLLIDYLTTPDTFNVELSEATEALRSFRLTCSSRFRMNEIPVNGITEWNAELSILKMIIEINDPERTFAGLTVTEVHEPTVYDSSVYEESYVEAENQHIDMDISEPIEAESKETSMITVLESKYPDLDIIDLSRKMDALSELQQHINRVAKDPPVEATQSFDDNDVLVGDTFSENGEFPEEVDQNDNNSDELMHRKNVISRYSLLFDDLANSQPESTEPSEGDDPANEIRVWNAVDRVWEDVTFQLNSRTEVMYEDSQILHLKVALAEQAKKLSDLGKKVSHLKDEERRLASSDAEFYDLTDYTECSETVVSSRDSVSGARKLVMRMEDLEERLICNEIEIQHLSMEAFSVEHDGEKMVNSLRKAEKKTLSTPKKVSEGTRETSGVSWGSGSTAAASQSQNSFLQYEKKVVRFNDDLTSVEFVESPDYAYYPKRADFSTPIVVLDDYMNEDSWQYPLIELIETSPSTPSTYNSSVAESEIDPAGKVIYISTSRDPDGSYMGPERTTKSDTVCGTEFKSYGSESGQDQRSSQAVSGNSVATSDDRLSNKAVATEQQVPVHSLLDAELSNSSEQSFNSMLLNILNAPTAETTILNSRASKNLSVRTEEESKDSPSRFQKLMAVKRKKFEKSPRSNQIPLDAYSNNSTKYKNYDRVFSNDNENAETVNSVNTSDAAVAEEVFRPAASITFNSPVSHREISAMSSDKSSSDINSARKVLEIERLITKYTSIIDAV